MEMVKPMRTEHLASHLKGSLPFGGLVDHSSVGRELPYCALQIINSEHAGQGPGRDDLLEREFSESGLFVIREFDLDEIDMARPQVADVERPVQRVFGCPLLLAHEFPQQQNLPVTCDKSIHSLSPFFLPAPLPIPIFGGVGTSHFTDGVRA